MAFHVSGKLKTELITSPISKSTSPGVSDSTFFAHWFHYFIIFCIAYNNLQTFSVYLKTIKTEKFSLFGIMKQSWECNHEI